MKKVNFDLIANKEERNGVLVYVLNKPNTFDFLEKKVAKLHECFENNFDNNYIKTEGTEKRFITN